MIFIEYNNAYSTTFFSFYFLISWFGYEEKFFFHYTSCHFKVLGAEDRPLEAQCELYNKTTPKLSNLAYEYHNDISNLNTLSNPFLSFPHLPG